jgi:hypothetical protein
MVNPEILEASYRAGAFAVPDRYGRIEFHCRSLVRSGARLAARLHMSPYRSHALFERASRRSYDVRVTQDYEDVIRAYSGVSRHPD